ncbi:M20/M25/M40 family metallo-hydrolase [Desmospora profundinema]|uniref:Aminopeptidase YwaD n=1 Tax=Desmospora profundinema TaxID=1571184 RepID=A0ABU1INV7_9BACL|nr:M20/M25/M40 family metallo-hydrolase [Desmospora profundinema]MDR6226207.1 aminopeptidase YwaD [Desmospora profundinema]
MKNKRWAILVFTLALALVFTQTAYAAPVHTQNVANKVSADRIYNHIDTLTKAPRVTGFKEEHRAADFIARQLKRYGLEVERQTFPIMAFKGNGAEVTVTTPEEHSLDAKPFTYTPPTPKEGLSADVVYAGLGQPEDFSDLDVEGKIVLIQRGAITFFEKSKNAADAGAIGAMIFNNVDGELSGTLGQPGPIPTVSLDKTDGESLKNRLMSDETVKARIKADVELNPSYSQNVIGTIKAQKGDTRQAKTIVVGAHYDSVQGSPGANDNASGSATLLEMARVLSKEKLRHDVRVIFFGAEEVGLVGSTRYVQSLHADELSRIAAMINLDMVGVGDTLGILTASEDDESFVADLAEDYVQTYGYNYERGASTRSDHRPFAQAGIPVAFLHYSPDPYYHSPEDSLDKISKRNLHNTGTLVTLLTHNLANDNKLSKPKKTNKLKQSSFPNPDWDRK